jgi:hypothetical protein
MDLVRYSLTYNTTLIKDYFSQSEVYNWEKASSSVPPHYEICEHAYRDHASLLLPLLAAFTYFLPVYAPTFCRVCLLSL